MSRRKQHVSAFIFDLDGTLIDSGQDIALSANSMRIHFGLPELPLPQVMEMIGDGVPTLLQRVLAREMPQADQSLLDEARTAFDGHYSRHCLDHTRPFPGVLEVLRRFAGSPLMVATNKPRRFTEQMLDGLNLSAAFTRVVAGDDVQNKKPDPEMLHRCLEGFGLDPTDVAVVGDSLNDLYAARAVGAVAVGCTFGLRPASEIIAAKPDVLLNTFAELSEHFASRHML